VAVWFSYFVRLAAAGVFLLVCLSLLLAALFASDGTTVLLIMAAAAGVAGWYAWPRRPNAWRSDPPTSRQLEYAEALGIEVPAGAKKGEVSALISAVTGR